jgi:hypothetical protein
MFSFFSLSCSIRFSYLLASPDYFQKSGLFRISDSRTKVKAGDSLYFYADQVCHRAPPPNLQEVQHQQHQQHQPPTRRKGGGQSSSSSSSSSSHPSEGFEDHLSELVGKRKVLFWFSWDEALADSKQSINQPDLDFQLNPWTLHGLLFKGKNYEDDQVHLYFLWLLFFHSYNVHSVFNFLLGCSIFLPQMDGLLSISTFWGEGWKKSPSWAWKNSPGMSTFLLVSCYF